MPKSLDRMIYVDDSGHPSSGLVVYGWVEFNPDRWASILKSWLDTRKRLWREHNIPVISELHATEYVNGRGRISKRVPERHVHNGVEYWKDFGREVAIECLETIRCTEGLTVGAVWRRADPKNFAANKRQTYANFISQIEHDLSESASLAIVFMDGDGTDQGYRSTHRNLKLARRHVIEDPIHLDSRGSQLVQMADLVAWTASVHVDRYPGNAFAWEWCSGYLSERDPRRTPQEI